VGVEPTTPVFERAKTVHSLDRGVGHCDRQIALTSSPIHYLSNHPIILGCVVGDTASMIKLIIWHMALQF
jgi:hypothetical protein